MVVSQERARLEARVDSLDDRRVGALVDGTTRPTSWAVTELSSADETVIAEPVRVDLRRTVVGVRTTPDVLGGGAPMIQLVNTRYGPQARNRLDESVTSLSWAA